MDIKIFDGILLTPAELSPPGVVQKTGYSRRLQTGQNGLQRNVLPEGMQFMRRTIPVFRRIGQIHAGISVRPRIRAVRDPSPEEGLPFSFWKA